MDLPEDKQTDRQTQVQAGGENSPNYKKTII